MCLVHCFIPPTNSESEWTDLALVLGDCARHCLRDTVLPSRMRSTWEEQTGKEFFLSGFVSDGVSPGDSRRVCGERV